MACFDFTAGKLTLAVLAAVAKFEADFPAERQRDGIEAAEAKWVYKGRPATIDPAAIRSALAAGETLPTRKAPRDSALHRVPAEGCSRGRLRCGSGCLCALSLHPAFFAGSGQEGTLITSDAC